MHSLSFVFSKTTGSQCNRDVCLGGWWCVLLHLLPPKFAFSALMEKLSACAVASFSLLDFATACPAFVSFFLCFLFVSQHCCVVFHFVSVCLPSSRTLGFPLSPPCVFLLPPAFLAAKVVYGLLVMVIFITLCVSIFRICVHIWCWCPSSLDTCLPFVPHFPPTLLAPLLFISRFNKERMKYNS